MTLPARSGGPDGAGASSSTQQQSNSPSGTSRPAAKKPRTQEPKQVQPATSKAAKAVKDKGKGRATGPGSDEEPSTGHARQNQPKLPSQASRPAKSTAMRRVASDSRTDLLPFDSMRDEPSEQGIIPFQWDQDAKGMSTC